MSKFFWCRNTPQDLLSDQSWWSVVNVKSQKFTKWSAEEDSWCILQNCVHMFYWMKSFFLLSKEVVSHPFPLVQQVPVYVVNHIQILHSPNQLPTIAQGSTCVYKTCWFLHSREDFALKIRIWKITFFYRNRFAQAHCNPLCTKPLIESLVWHFLAVYTGTIYI